MWRNPAVNQEKINKMQSAFCQTFLQEFNSHNRNLDHDKPEEFAKSQWQGNSAVREWIFVLYRWSLASFLVCALISSMFVDGSGIKWPIYLTNWGFTILTVQAVLASSLATGQKFSNAGFSTSMTILHKSYWVLNNLSGANSTLISVGYWATVYDPETHPMSFINVTTHMFNLVTVIVDTFIAGHPFRLFHAYQQIIFAFIYLIFTAIYFIAGGTDKDGNTAIYGILDWNKPQWTLLYVIIAGLFLVFIHFIFWLFYLVRCKIANKLLNTEESLQNQSDDDVTTSCITHEGV